MRTLGSAMTAVAFVMALASCSPGSTVGSVTSPRASVTPSSRVAPSSPGSSTPSPCKQVNFVFWLGVCDGRVATPEEAAAIVAATHAAAAADLGLPDWWTSPCHNSTPCFYINADLQNIVGTDAAAFAGGSACGSCGSSSCSVFVYRDAAGWHYVNSICSQVEGYGPGRGDHVFVSGCANVREGPSLSATVLACLANGTQVDVDRAPLYQHQHIWWHLVGRGWMAHDFLVAPKECNEFSQPARPLPANCCWSARTEGCNS